MAGNLRDILAMENQYSMWGGNTPPSGFGGGFLTTDPSTKNMNLPVVPMPRPYAERSIRAVVRNLLGNKWLTMPKFGKQRGRDPIAEIEQEMRDVAATQLQTTVNRLDSSRIAAVMRSVYSSTGKEITVEIEREIQNAAETAVMIPEMSERFIPSGSVSALAESLTGIADMSLRRAQLAAPGNVGAVTAPRIAGMGKRMLESVTERFFDPVTGKARQGVMAGLKATDVRDLAQWLARRGITPDITFRGAADKQALVEAKTQALMVDKPDMSQADALRTTTVEIDKIAELGGEALSKAAVDLKIRKYTDKLEAYTNTAMKLGKLFDPTGQWTVPAVLEALDKWTGGAAMWMKPERLEKVARRMRAISEASGVNLNVAAQTITNISETGAKLGLQRPTAALMAQSAPMWLGAMREEAGREPYWGRPSEQAMQRVNEYRMAGTMASSRTTQIAGAATTLMNMVGWGPKNLSRIKDPALRSRAERFMTAINRGSGDVLEQEYGDARTLGKLIRDVGTSLGGESYGRAQARQSFMAMSDVESVGHLVNSLPEYGPGLGRAAMVAEAVDRVNKVKVRAQSRLEANTQDFIKETGLQGVAAERVIDIVTQQGLESYKGTRREQIQATATGVIREMSKDKTLRNQLIAISQDDQKRPQFEAYILGISKQIRTIATETLPPETLKDPEIRSAYEMALNLVKKPKIRAQDEGKRKASEQMAVIREKLPESKMKVLADVLGDREAGILSKALPKFLGATELQDINMMLAVPVLRMEEIEKSLKKDDLEEYKRDSLQAELDTLSNTMVEMFAGGRGAATGKVGLKKYRKGLSEFIKKNPLFAKVVGEFEGLLADNRLKKEDAKNTKLYREMEAVTSKSNKEWLQNQSDALEKMGFESRKAGKEGLKPARKAELYTELKDVQLRTAYDLENEFMRVTTTYDTFQEAKKEVLRTLPTDVSEEERQRIGGMNREEFMEDLLRREYFKKGASSEQTAKASVTYKKFREAEKAFTNKPTKKTYKAYARVWGDMQEVYKDLPLVAAEKLTERLGETASLTEDKLRKSLKTEKAEELPQITTASLEKQVQQIEAIKKGKDKEKFNMFAPAIPDVKKEKVDKIDYLNMLPLTPDKLGKQLTIPPYVDLIIPTDEDYNEPYINIRGDTTGLYDVNDKTTLDAGDGKYQYIGPGSAELSSDDDSSRLPTDKIITDPVYGIVKKQGGTSGKGGATGSWDIDKMKKAEDLRIQTQPPDGTTDVQPTDPVTNISDETERKTIPKKHVISGEVSLKMDMENNLGKHVLTFSDTEGVFV